MSVEEQDKLARQVGQMETTAKCATEAHKLSFPMAGKVVCVVEERLNELKSDRNPDGTIKKRQIASNTSLAAYWETVTRANGKSVKLNPHWLSCAVAFGTYVRSELVSEPDYDKCKADWLETAASISTAVGGDITHAAVAAAAEELRDRNKDCAKTLRAILESVKEPKALTAEKAQAMLDKVFASGHLNLVIAGVGAEIAHLENSEEARSAYFGMITANAMFAANVTETLVDGKTVVTRRFDDETMNAWQAAYDKASETTAAAPQTAETPAAVAA